MKAALSGLLCLMLFAPALAGAQSAGESQPPVTIPSMSVDVTDGLLSVDIKDEEFGNVIGDIANKAGFKAEIEGAVASKKLSTVFKKVNMEAGIIRLITLAGEKNYFIYYDEKGSISKLEVYKGAPQPAPKQTTTRKPPPMPAQRQVQPLPQPPLQPYDESFDETGEEEQDAPYIPPSKEPVFIQPIKRK
jgi:hypothetical protein